jgi:Mrp family chromosome partitioning ATPase
MTATEENQVKKRPVEMPVEVSDLPRLAESVADQNFRDGKANGTSSSNRPGPQPVAPARPECCPVAEDGLFAALHKDFAKDYVERFQLLRTQLMLLRARMKSEVDVRMIAVMSTHDGEGKSFTATNLAAVLAKFSNQRVLLMEANQGGGNLPLGLDDSAVGLRQALEKPEAWQQSVYPVKGSSLSVMPRGPECETSIDFEPLPRLLVQLREHFEWVVLDGASFSSSPDAEWISSVADGTLLVTQRGSAKFDALQDSLGRIPAERMAGVVFNERPLPKRARRLRIRFSGSWRG